MRRSADPSAKAAETSEILLAEEDPELRHVLASVLRGEGHSVSLARDRRELADRLGELSFRLLAPDLIVADIRMDGALELLERVHGSELSLTPILVVTTEDDPSEEAAELRRLSAIFELPRDLDDLRAAVRSLLPAALEGSPS